jgi:fructose-bisphosphate aldolase class 1
LTLVIVPTGVPWKLIFTYGRALPELPSKTRPETEVVCPKAEISTKQMSAMKTEITFN